VKKCPPRRDFMKEKMLIMEGNPGTGKTSLMRRLAYEWAREKPELLHYDLIMYAEFREVRKNKFTHISEFVTSYLEPYVGKDIFMGFQKIVTDVKWFKDGHKVLVLLDGFDESIKKQCTELDSYLTKDSIDKHPLFNIVMTTRPGHLPAELKEHIGRFVFGEVLGFTTDEQKMNYISNHFSKNRVEAESIHLFLKSKEVQEVTTTKQKDVYVSNHFKNTEIDAIKGEALSVYVMLQSNRSLRELAETPLFLTFICLVNKQIINGILLDLYCNIVRWLLDRHQKIHQDSIDVPSLFEYHPEPSSYELRKDTIINKWLNKVRPRTTCDRPLFEVFSLKIKRLTIS
jgi:predicted NACHT family NTPase